MFLFKMHKAFGPLW